MAEYKGMKMTIEWGTRLCEVDGELGYFHTWEQYAMPIGPSVMRGGHSGGQKSQVYGIVEFADRVARIEPYKIKFRDKINATLTSMTEAIEKVKEWEGVNDEST